MSTTKIPLRCQEQSPGHLQIPKVCRAQTNMTVSKNQYVLLCADLHLANAFGFQAEFFLHIGKNNNVLNQNCIFISQRSLLST